MPRLVSLTLLSFLALPGGAIVYILVVAVAESRLEYRHEHWAYVIAGAVTLPVVIKWWLAVWAGSVRWTIGRKLATAGAVVAALAVGLGVAYTASVLREGRILPALLGSVSAIVAWMVAACILWRTKPAELADAATSKAAVRCPRCRYDLTGLREARCPECGESYTLDALFAAQRPNAALGDGT